MANSEENCTVEYYRSFSGYNLPLNLIDKTTKEAAEANSADAAYFIAYFNSNRRLVKVVKMFHGNILFEHRYFYYQNGKLMRKEEKKNSALSVQEFDESGKVRKQ